jgi:hypothetical protein
MDAAVMKPVDREALTRAIALTTERTRDEPRRDGETQIEHMLKNRPWREVGEFAAYGQQMHALQLRPWQHPPCWVGTDDPDPEACPRGRAAQAIARQQSEPLRARSGCRVASGRGARPWRSAAWPMPSQKLVSDGAWQANARREIRRSIMPSARPMMNCPTNTELVNSRLNAGARKPFRHNRTQRACRYTKLPKAFPDRH